VAKPSRTSVSIASRTYFALPLTPSSTCFREHGSPGNSSRSSSGSPTGTTPAETGPAASLASPPSGSAASASSTTTAARKAAPSGSSRRTPTAASAPAKSVSTRRLTATEVDWERLSPRGAAILRQIAIPRSEGSLLIEIAAELGISKNSVSRLLRELFDEIEQARELRAAPSDSVRSSLPDKGHKGETHVTGASRHLPASGRRKDER
jgi:DNA-binding CsgD family transcriptional regulator